MTLQTIFKCNQCGLDFEFGRKKTYSGAGCRHIVQMRNQYKWQAANADRYAKLRLNFKEKRAAAKALELAATQDQ